MQKEKHSGALSGETPWDSLLNLLFPRKCACCGSVVAGGALCGPCEKKLLPLACAAQPCGDEMEGLYAAFPYGGAGEALIKAFKFHSRFHCYELALREPFEDAMECALAGLAVELVLPVPLYAAARRARGFNQAAYIAQRLAQRLGASFDEKILQKNRRNEVQHHLPKERRAENVKGVYTVAVPEGVRNKTVLLVDDITTTGATLRECAAVLKAAGAARVYGAAVLATPKGRHFEKV